MNNKDLMGKTIVYYEPYSRNIADSAKEAVVTNVGHKYITAAKMKFEIDTMTCQTLHYRLYIGTLQEFQEAVRLQKEISSLLFSLQKEADINLPLPLLREFHQRMQELKNKIGGQNGQ